MEIAKHYLKTFFFLDLISSLPLDYILLSVSPEANINQLVHAGLICFCPVFVTTARDTVIFLKHDRGGRSEWSNEFSKAVFSIGAKRSCAF